jgi:CRISPR-associated endonuclease/helicase Cas3
MPLYPFQEKVYDHLMGGQSVILQAPTGAGKTRAALYPFLRSWEYDENFPRKCIYAVPMRVLANQFNEEYSELVANYNFLRPMKVEIQTGEHRKDPRFESDLIFATIDQVLSSFLIAPYSLPKRLSNFNAGAIAGAYLVFDEFHLFEPTSTLPTTLEMLKMLKGVAPFLLMTATFSGDMLAGLAEQLGAVVVPGSQEARAAMQAIPSQDKTRHYHVIHAPLDADAVMRNHRQRSLVVCNVVDRARQLYQDLRMHPELGDTKVILLHSRFLPKDRKRIEDRIRNRFKKGDQEGSWIAVATQVIEVGLNITCEVLHTELAPANAVLQRAGRCARYAGETGNVYVYTESTGDDGTVLDLTEQAWPYQEQRDVIKRTVTAFEAYQDQPMSFSDEQAAVSTAHGPDDQRTLLGLAATQTSHRDAMSDVMNGYRHANAGDLIRAVSSQLIVIHDKPEALLHRPFGAEAFSLHPGTVRKHVKAWSEAGQLQPSYVQMLGDAGDADESGQSAYAWTPVNDTRALQGASLILIHPDLAGYDADLGLLLDRGTGYRAEIGTPSTAQGYGMTGYRLETYVDHTREVYSAINTQVWPAFNQTARRLEEALTWPPGIIERAAHLVVLFHDVGKLNAGWQQWVTTYQEAIGRPVTPGAVYAHTDYDPTDPTHHLQQQAAGRRPPHAVEGATAVAPLLAAALEGLEPLVKAAFTAIARHHGAFTRQGKSYRLVNQAPIAIAETIAWLPDPVRGKVNVNALWARKNPTEGQIRTLFVNPGSRKELLPYMILARALRYGDQLGTQEGSK